MNAKDLKHLISNFEQDQIVNWMREGEWYDFIGIVVDGVLFYFDSEEPTADDIWSILDLLNDDEQDALVTAWDGDEEYDIVNVLDAFEMVQNEELLLEDIAPDLESPFDVPTQPIIDTEAREYGTIEW